MGNDIASSTGCQSHLVKAHDQDKVVCDLDRGQVQEQRGGPSLAGHHQSRQGEAQGDAHWVRHGVDGNTEETEKANRPPRASCAPNEPENIVETRKASP